jgi:ABC-type Na+ efflux pump permease subunit
MKSMSKALIKKDVKEITGSKQVFLPMIIVPLVLMVVLPAVLVVVSRFGEGALNSINGIDMLLDKLPADLKNLAPGQLLLYIAVNFMFPTFFLLIPIMASGILGASSFVGEKEHKTMETLLYTPVSMEQLLRAKILGVFIPSYIIALLSFVAFGIIINIGGFMHFDKLIFPDFKWLITILWLTPAITLLSLTFTVIVSAKSSTFQEAQQVSALLVLPVILLLIGQMTGLFFLNEIILLILGAVIFIADYILIKRIARKFVPEKLI